MRQVNVRETWNLLSVDGQSHCLDPHSALHAEWTPNDVIAWICSDALLLEYSRRGNEFHVHLDGVAVEG
jgi:hypothetical protein